MSTQFYCVFGSEDAEHLGIDPKGWIEIHANSIEHAHQIAFTSVASFEMRNAAGISATSWRTTDSIML